MRNFVLIGMPGAGKSTVGVELAKVCGIPFMDTDQFIEASLNQSLQEILQVQGLDRLLTIENDLLLSMALPQKGVIATGGSVIYSEPVMSKLGEWGTVVYLQATLATVRNRVDNWLQRGFVCKPGMSLSEVYEERIVLYKHYADILVDVDKALPAELAATIVASAIDL